MFIYHNALFQTFSSNIFIFEEYVTRLINVFDILSFLDWRLGAFLHKLKDINK